MTRSASWIAAFGLLGALLALPSIASAQNAGRQARQGRQSQPPAVADDDAPTVSPAEIRRMFDSYALMQAQDQLKITNEQFPKFLMQFKALQELRRKTQQERNRLIQDLRRLSTEATANEGQLKETMKALSDLDDRSHAELRKASDAVDQVLDTQQQARFRVFEQQMEQRLLQLVARARQANRAKPKS
jgi:hypothetical protein